MKSDLLPPNNFDDYKVGDRVKIIRTDYSSGAPLVEYGVDIGDEGVIVGMLAETEAFPITINFGNGSCVACCVAEIQKVNQYEVDLI